MNIQEEFLPVTFLPFLNHVSFLSLFLSLSLFLPPSLPLFLSFVLSSFLSSFLSSSSCVYV